MTPRVLPPVAVAWQPPPGKKVIAMAVAGPGSLIVSLLGEERSTQDVRRLNLDTGQEGHLQVPAPGEVTGLAFQVATGTVAMATSEFSAGDRDTLVILAPNTVPEVTSLSDRAGYLQPLLGHSHAFLFKVEERVRTHALAGAPGMNVGSWPADRPCSAYGCWPRHLVQLGPDGGVLFIDNSTVYLARPGLSHQVMTTGLPAGEAPWSLTGDAFSGQSAILQTISGVGWHAWVTNDGASTWTPLPFPPELMKAGFTPVDVQHGHVVAAKDVDWRYDGDPIPATLHWRQQDGAWTNWPLPAGDNNQTLVAYHSAAAPDEIYLVRGQKEILRTRVPGR